MEDAHKRNTQKRLSGMKGFTLVWAGQLVSVLASQMTNFALTIWIFEQTESATAMAVLQVCFILPFLLLSPIAGVMVDRYDRKLMMAISDFGAVTSTIGLLILQATGNAQCPLHRKDKCRLYWQGDIHIVEFHQGAQRCCDNAAGAR